MGMVDTNVLEKVETAFGFPMYGWQRKYLLGDNNAFPSGGRGNGKTFAYCLKLLLTEGGPPIDLREIASTNDFIDEHHGWSYQRWFHRFIQDINDTLMQNRICTNAVTNKKEE